MNDATTPWIDPELIAAGNVRTETMRAFDAREFAALTGK